MTDPGLLAQAVRDRTEAWSQLEQLDIQVAELTEMLTAATDTALQRGKTIDAMREALIQRILDEADGG